jgi:starvation-inducible DNA-binding protein
MSNKPVTEALKTVLADSYTLYLKTQFFHWNVTGPHFRSLHLLFEEQYTDLQTAVDDIAERIRTLGEVAPGSFKAYGKLSGITEAESVPAAADMVKALAGDQDVILASLQKALEAAQKAGDEATIGMVTDRITIHEKNRWMLKSSM